MVAVAETGNFTRAAERCNVSQPSLSQQIINLENELEHKLFHRLSRHAVLTDAGTKFLERARRILFEADDAAKELRDDPDVGRKIVVGAIPTLGPYVFSQLLTRCRNQFPHLVVHTREAFRSELINAVLEGELDLALVSQPVDEPRLALTPLFEEPLLLVVNRSHRLAGQKIVTAADLTEETFVLLGESSTLAAQIQRFCGAHDFEPRIAHRCAQIATVKSLVALGAGISILPELVRFQDDHRSLVYRALSQGAPNREIIAIRHLQRYQSLGAEQFLSVVRTEIASSRRQRS